MRGILFEERTPVAGSAPNRADVALFVGFADLRRSPLPAALADWLRESGWSEGPYRRSRRAVNQLFDVPVPVESWETFDRLFAWDRRPLDGQGAVGATYLGAAVRSFFAQGGRKCYVVRVGRPFRYTSPLSYRNDKLERLIPGYSGGILPAPVDRASWRGIGHVFGLPEVSFLCLPDLCDLVRPNPRQPQSIEPEPPEVETFVECSAEEAAGGEERSDPAPVRHGAPRMDDAGFRAWAKAVRLAGTLLARHGREVQLVASVPIPRPDTVASQGGERFSAGDDLLRYLLARRWLSEALVDGQGGVASAFVQLAYPWARTPISGQLPGGVEPPEGVVAGVLARNALTRGAFRSAGGLELGDVWDLFPRLGRDQTDRPQTHSRRRGVESLSLSQRVTLLGPTPTGHRLLSDVTTSLDESYRPASINRLVSAIVRAARREGEDSVFESSGERVWERLEDRLEELMRGLLRDGALRGESPRDAYEVRCDRTTMSQNDLDNGRVVARVLFQPSAPVERIHVVLAMEEGGRVALAPPAAATGRAG